MARAALESLPLARKWTEKKSQSPPGLEEEKTRGGESQRGKDVKDKGWKKCKCMVTVIGARSVKPEYVLGWK